MSAVAETKRRPATIGEQAALLDYFMDRCVRDGVPVDTARITLDKDDIIDLLAIAARLKRMAPFEVDIRRLVTGR